MLLHTEWIRHSRKMMMAGYYCPMVRVFSLLQGRKCPIIFNQLPITRYVTATVILCDNRVVLLPVVVLGARVDVLVI